MKKSKKSTRMMVLDRETLRALAPEEVRLVSGGDDLSQPWDPRGGGPCSACNGCTGKY